MKGLLLWKSVEIALKLSTIFQNTVFNLEVTKRSRLRYSNLYRYKMVFSLSLLPYSFPFKCHALKSEFKFNYIYILLLTNIYKSTHTMHKIQMFCLKRIMHRVTDV